MYIVTGANGFIGSAIVRELNARGIDNIICVDVVSPKERPEPLKKCKYKQYMDAQDFLSWAAQNRQPHTARVVIHMGAISSTTETDWNKLVLNNIQLSQALSELCVSWQARYVYASSGAVYGDGTKGFSVTTPPNEFTPLNLYGRSKRDFDSWILSQATTPKHWYGVRFFNVYGPNEYHKNDMASVVYKAYLQIKTAGHLKLFKSHNSKYKDGEQLRDFVYIKDVVRWVLELCEDKPIPSGIYNLGYGTARTWLDLAQNTFSAMNLEMHIDWIDIPLNIRNQYQYFTEADMTKSFSAGLTMPKFPLEEGIHDYLKNYLLTQDPYL